MVFFGVEALAVAFPSLVPGLTNRTNGDHTSASAIRFGKQWIKIS